MFMCPREKTDAVSPDSNAVTGKISTLTELERREEIDMRVGTLLAKREAERWQYQRGFWDAIYVICVLACIAYLVWAYMGNEAK